MIAWARRGKMVKTPNPPLSCKLLPLLKFPTTTSRSASVEIESVGALAAAAKKEEEDP